MNPVLTPDMIESTEAKLIGFLPNLVKTYLNSDALFFTKREELIDGAKRGAIVIAALFDAYTINTDIKSEIGYPRIYEILRKAASEYVEPYKSLLLHAIDLYQEYTEDLEKRFSIVSTPSNWKSRIIEN